MEVLLVRHAPAEDRAAFAATGRPDAERPLTRRGRKRMQAAADGLVRLVPGLDALATSPYIRTSGTAAVIADAYGGIAVTDLDALRPGGDPAEVLAWLRDRDEHGTVALVGHEPDLGRLAGWLLTGRPAALWAFKKGGACLLDGAPALEQGPWTLRWLCTPRQLRTLGAA